MLHGVCVRAISLSGIALSRDSPLPAFLCDVEKNVQSV